MSFGQRRTGFGGNQGGSFGSFKKPVEVGKEYNVTISDTSKRGEGIAKIDGFVIFVPGTRMGQQARIKVMSVGERFASGQVVENAAAETGSAAATTTPAPAESAEKTS